MATPAQIELAKKLHEGIKTTRRTSTRDLFQKLGIDDNQIGPRCRKVMNALAEAGILSRQESGKLFYWSSLINDVTDNAYDSALAQLSSASREPKVKSEGSKGLEARIRALEAAAVQAGRLTISIQVNGGKPIDLPKGSAVPACFEHLLSLAAARLPILLVGPAGCGKTFVGALVAKSLGLGFSAISCTAGMSETHLLGRSVPNITDGTNRFQSTDFLEAYEQGGVFLLDEMDAADSNLLLIMNTAIANGYVAVPSRTENPIAKKHPDFVIIASANTFGRGADRMYVGRCQLDEATLDRFRIGTIEMDYDRKIEESICPDARLINVLWQIRDKIVSNKLRRIMSTRFIENAYRMLTAGWNVEKIVDVFFQGWSQDERTKCMPIIPKAEEAGQSDSGSTEGSEGDGWKLPALSAENRRLLDDAGCSIVGVSPKQVEYAERIVSKWMSDMTVAQINSMISEIKAVREQIGSRFASRIIEWNKARYIPGNN